MSCQRFAATACAVIALAAASAPSFAQGADGPIMLNVVAMDNDKDGMVSKKEFLDAMGKYYDAKAKEMKAKDGRFTAAQLREMLMNVHRSVMAGAGG